MTGSESDEHKRLKSLALRWARVNGYRIAAPEVSVPQFRVRIDAAAYKPIGWNGKKLVDADGHVAIGTTVIFECKQSRADFLTDCHEEAKIRPQLEKLREKKAFLDRELRRHFPSLRNGDSLFPEYETYRLGDAGYEPYDCLLAEIQLLSNRLFEKTKFDTLTRWQAANLHYVVTTKGIVKPGELPSGWGLLESADSDDMLIVVAQPTFFEVPEENRLMLLQRIAFASSRRL